MVQNIFSFVRSCEKEYKELLGIKSFPTYKIVPKVLSIQKSNQQGFDSLATAFYDTSSGAHKIEIWSALSHPQMNARYIVFHEFTHILDAETFSQKDKYKYFANKGYTEYHAAQIELLCLLGVKNMASIPSFSMDRIVETATGEKTVAEFADTPRVDATKMIKRPDFPASLEALATTIGMIFNYYGRRSICQMYSNDYEDNADMSAIAQYLTPVIKENLDKFLCGWCNNERVSLIDYIYPRMVTYLATQAKLG